MEKRLLSLGLLWYITISIYAVKLTFHITQPKKDAKLTIVFHDDTRKDIPLKDGKGSIDIKESKPQYAILTYGDFEIDRLVYLQSDKDQTVTFNGNTFDKAITFTGTDAVINNYLNHTDFALLKFEDAVKEEPAYLKIADSVYTTNMALLRKANLPSAFKQQEAIRLKYVSYRDLPWYRTYHMYWTKTKDFTTSDIYQQKVNSLTVINADYLMFKEYKRFIFYAIRCLSMKEKPSEDQGKAFTEYVQEHVKDQKVRDFLTDSYIYDLVAAYGLTAYNDTLIAFYHKTVKDTAMTKRFDAMLAQWKLLEPGHPSPAFSFPDINGKTVSLADLKGKYVYIDVWATWCGPCRAELPYLKELEKTYAGKDIVFVSMSCDEDKVNWQKMVVKDQMKGIQLYMGNKSDFMKRYMIKGIPRFILLDKEGKIIKADAPRPSHPAIKEQLNKLLSKD